MVPIDYKTLLEIMSLQHKNQLHNQAMLSLNFNLNQLYFLNQMNNLGNMINSNPFQPNIRQLYLQNTQNYLQCKPNIITPRIIQQYVEETKDPAMVIAIQQKQSPEKFQSKIEAVVEPILEDTDKSDDISSSHNLLAQSKKMYFFSMF